MPRTVVAISLVLAMGAAAGAAGSAPIVIGAVYPTGGGQGPGGTEEFRGAAMAADYANPQAGGRGGLSSYAWNMRTHGMPPHSPSSGWRTAGSPSSLEVTGALSRARLLRWPRVWAWCFGRPVP